MDSGTDPLGPSPFESCPTHPTATRPTKEQVVIPPAASGRHDATRIAAPHRPCVLVVDDQTGIRQLLSLALTYAGFHVAEAASAQAGLELYGRRHADIAMVLVDFHLPDADGAALIQSLRSIAPKTRCCIMSADSSPAVERQARAAGAAHCFRKPFDVMAVAKQLWQLLESPH